MVVVCGKLPFVSTFSVKIRIKGISGDTDILEV